MLSDITIGQFFPGNSALHKMDPRVKLVVIFAAVTTQKEITPQPEEIAEADWVPVDEALTRLTYERDRKILREALIHIHKHYEKQPKG